MTGALAAAVPPGRLELIPGKPAILLDGAHNAEGMQALVRELDGVLGTRRPRIGVVAFQDDKPIAAMLEALAPALDAVIVTTSGHSGHSRAKPVQALADAARAAGFTDVFAEAEPFIALAQARDRAGAQGRRRRDRIPLPAGAPARRRAGGPLACAAGGASGAYSC